MPEEGEYTADALGFALGDDAMDVDLADVRFAQDLPISGHITYGNTTIDAAVTLARWSRGAWSRTVRV